jgi:6-phosphogluconolactonase
MELKKSHSQDEAVSRATDSLLTYLTQQTRTETTLLLSGGSATLIYQQLVQKSHHFDSLKWLQVGQIDERWGAVGHVDSNQRAIRNTGLVEAWERKGAQFHWVLHEPTSLTETADSYQSWLETRFATTSVLAVLGVGGDGHTAGILPFQDQVLFDHTFPDDRIFVGYEYPQETEFPQRLTVTPSALQSLTWFTGVMWGENKEPVWQKLGESKPLSVSQFPVQLLTSVPGVFYFGA